MIDIIIGLVLVGIMMFAILTIAAIVETVLDYMPEANVVEIFDPKVSKELERIAAEKGSKAHKRFGYDRNTKKAVLVESNNIADELKGEEYIKIAVH